MREVTGDIRRVQDGVKELIGQTLKIILNPGRNKIFEYEGGISGTYPSLFTLDVRDKAGRKNLTCSYSDVLCGKVRLSRI